MEGPTGHAQPWANVYNTYTMASRIALYTDGACHPNPDGRGGWAALLVRDGQVRALHGSAERTTNNRMELLAAIKGLEATPPGSEVVVFSDSEYLVKTMAGSWRRRANLDLWQQLDALTAERTVHWEWIRGHAGHPWNEEANRLAEAEARGLPIQFRPPTREESEPPVALAPASMVDISEKPPTAREAVAEAWVHLAPEAYRALRDAQLPKGDALALAQAAGILAAKQTPYLIPLCHSIPLAQVTVTFDFPEATQAVRITASAKTNAPTGPEMEALTAAAIAALTIHDMCKGLDPAARIEGLRVLRKSGGKSGDLRFDTPNSPKA
jgi:cyclic pyranopterin phosphate synthase